MNLSHLKKDLRTYIDHSQKLSTLISAKRGLGATEGTFILEDHNKSLFFKHDTSESTLIPTLFFQKSKKDPLFCRLQYSAQECDETFKENLNTNVTLSTKIDISAKS